MAGYFGELPKLTGTETEGSNPWRKVASWLGTLDELDGETLLLGLVSVAVIVGIGFSRSRVPGALVLVIGGLSPPRCLTSRSEESP